MRPKDAKVGVARYANVETQITRMRERYSKIRTNYDNDFLKVEQMTASKTIRPHCTTAANICAKYPALLSYHLIVLAHTLYIRYGCPCGIRAVAI